MVGTINMEAEQILLESACNVVSVTDVMNSKIILRFQDVFQISFYVMLLLLNA